MQSPAVHTLSRRAALEAIGVGALGLAGAALLGCGSTPGASTVASTGGSGGTAAGVEILPLTAPKAQGKPRKGGVLTQTLGANTYVEHDSHTQRGASEWHVIGEKLLEADFTDAKTMPHVATSWEVADKEGLTLTFKIKPGIKTHNLAPWNGRDFDATDVAWNLERIGGLYAERLKIPLAAFQRASMVQNITKAEAVDKNTVKVTLSSPNSGLFAGISENRTVLMPKEMDDIGFNDPMKFGGIGPYQISEVKKGQSQSYKRFDQYFRPNEPSFDQYVQQVIPDSAATIAAFSTNQIQIYRPPTSVEQEQVKKTKPDSLLYTWIDSNWHHIRPSMTYQPLQDFRVRQALHLSLDYIALGDQEEGAGWGFQAALNPGFIEAWKPGKVKTLPGYNPDTKEKDRGEARKLLEAAGYANGKGIEFKILFSSSGEPNAPAVIAQSQWTTTFPDMKVALEPVDTGTFSTRQTKNQFQTLSYTITAVPDAVLEMVSQYHSQGSRNYGEFRNKDVDAILDKAIKELNFDARKQLLEEFQTRFVNEWRPMYVLHANAARYITQSNIGGFDTVAGTWFGYSANTKVCRWFYVDK